MITSDERWLMQRCGIHLADTLAQTFSIIREEIERLDAIIMDHRPSTIVPDEAPHDGGDENMTQGPPLLLEHENQHFCPSCWEPPVSCEC